VVRRSVVLVLLLVVLGGVGATSACSGAEGPGGSAQTRAAVPGPSLVPPVTASLTAADEAWLDTVERLSPRMTAVLSDSPRAMTGATLQGLAGDLRACTRELARLGTPSPWLRPVRDLAREACREYDKGAACFADAAGVLSASGVQHDLDCGFAAASRGGRPLADALQLSQELRASR
jgi:hypothetical protein